MKQYGSAREHEILRSSHHSVISAQNEKLPRIQGLITRSIENSADGNGLLKTLRVKRYKARSRDVGISVQFPNLHVLVSVTESYTERASLGAIGSNRENLMAICKSAASNFFEATLQ